MRFILYGAMFEFCHLHSHKIIILCEIINLSYMAYNCNILIATGSTRVNAVAHNIADLDHLLAGLQSHKEIDSAGLLIKLWEG